MSRYVVKFTKDGYVKYTSHLDLLRIFKRTFKKTGINLRYSQGFNPHPKMGFAQPLSLGYSSRGELIEFETIEQFDPEEILRRLKEAMPLDLTPVSCVAFDSPIKSLAGEADSADYLVWIPEPKIADKDDLNSRIAAYLDKKEIIAMKRQKKTKALAPVDIRRQIRRLEGMITDRGFILSMTLDCGSLSNLSPELVITTYMDHIESKTPRHDIEVERTALRYNKKLQI